MFRPTSVVLALVFILQVVLQIVRGAAILEGRPYHDEPYYPTDLDGANSTKYNELSAGLKWNKSLLTYNIINYPVAVPADLIRSSIRHAFDAWSEVTNLDFVESANAAQVDIQIGFEGVNHYRRGVPCQFSQEITLAHAFFPEAGDIHFNTKYFFTGDTSIEQFLNTAVHEIGHSLGLFHSSSRDSIMYGAQLELRSKPQPEDIQAIQAIYGVRSGIRPTTQAPTSATRPTVKVIKPRTTTNLCSLESYDTIVIDHRGHICVLADRFYYNLNETNPPARKISAKWPKLPPKVDAAVTYRDQKTYFFKGAQYWKYDKRQLEERYPRPTDVGFLGLPSSIDALLLSKGGGFLVFKDQQYWFYDTRKAKPVEWYYPKSTDEFAGFPKRLDAALVTAEGRRFIFSGLRYWEVDDNNYVIGRGGDVRRDWFNC
ncbi:stromelysin-1-like [Topomyia yanbarensis]|uniref:stromelysin-1-like n=1 Tax=Topomyia yanbarensis TaxID=2498891 RepID=UPI00273A86EB|nr:stromelysin-1-like [Topomyia yanbarensis]XP_058839763.1 stromelysin-1-like [Topomyia yanbarensis]